MKDFLERGSVVKKGFIGADLGWRVAENFMQISCESDWLWPINDGFPAEEPEEVNF